MADQTGAAKAPTPPAEPPAAPPASLPTPAPDAPNAASNNRQYGIFRELKLDVSSAASRKEAVEELVDYGFEGSVTVLVRVGRTVAPDPKSAIRALGQVKDLDGDYEVIADGGRNKIPNVRSKTVRDVSIG